MTKSRGETPEEYAGRFALELHIVCGLPLNRARGVLTINSAPLTDAEFAKLRAQFQAACNGSTP